MEIKNVSELITKQTKLLPDKKAIVQSRSLGLKKYKYPSYTFGEFNRRMHQFCHKLSELGIKRGDRVLFFVSPDLDFACLTFSLFRMGVVPVFIDPGMKREHFFACIKEIKPRVLIAIPKVHYMRHFIKGVFDSVEIFITTGSFGVVAKPIHKRLESYQEDFPAISPEQEELAAILYTSGGTGRPKGVEYTHDIFINQTYMLQKEFNLTSDDTDIPGFPLFSFFTLAMGMTSTIPDMDFAKPIECVPDKLYQNIMDAKATFLAGSPAIWERLADYCLEQKLTLDTVKYVVMFGAPVSINIHKKFSHILPNGTTYTPYGATECLPVANISGEFILKQVQTKMLEGEGICVGKNLDSVEIKIIKETSEKIEEISQVEIMDAGEVGEIIVKSPNVTKRYFHAPDETEQAKIKDGNDLWHRMGDMGYLDDNGVLWFCGRKKHVIEFKSKKYYPVQIESIFNQHPKISRSALVTHKTTKKPVLIIQRKDETNEIEPMFLMDLKNIGQKNDKTKIVDDFIVQNKFPLDTRHNIKIDRIKLAKELQ